MCYSVSQREIFRGRGLTGASQKTCQGGVIDSIWELFSWFVPSVDVLLSERCLAAGEAGVTPSGLMPWLMAQFSGGKMAAPTAASMVPGGRPAHLRPLFSEAFLEPAWRWASQSETIRTPPLCLFSSAILLFSDKKILFLARKVHCRLETFPDT